MISAFCSRSPPARSLIDARDMPKSSGRTVYVRTAPSRTSDTRLSPVLEISSRLSAPCTTKARTVPSSASTRASGSVSDAVYTPMICAFAAAGLVSGPSMLKTVRTPISRRAGITCFIAVCRSGA